MIPEKITITLDTCPEGIKVLFAFNKSVVSLLKLIHPNPRTKYKGKAFQYWYFKELDITQFMQTIGRMKNIEVVMSDDVQEIYATQIVKKANETQASKERGIYAADWLKNNPLPIKLYDHQITGIYFLLERKRALLADEQGLGKTFTVLVTAKILQDYYKSQGNEVDIVVLCPAFLKSNWESEAEKIGVNIQTSSYENTPSVFEKDYIMICDEIHLKVENDKSKRTQNYYELAETALHLYNLTATPMSNGKLLNFYPALKAMNVSIAKDKYKYMMKFCDPHDNGFGMSFDGCSNIEEFNRHVTPYIIQRKKHDCLDLPPKQVIDLVIKPSDISLSHKSMADRFLQELREEYERKVENDEISEQGEHLVLFTHLRRHSSIYKADYTVNMVKNLVKVGEPITVFTEFKDTANFIAGCFDVIPVTSKTPQKQKDVIINNFQRGDSKVFVGTIGSCGVGVTLTAARYSIIHDFPWKPSALSQVEDRIHRIGQGRDVTIYHLYANKIDYVIAKIIGMKSENIEKVTAKYRLVKVGSETMQQAMTRVGLQLLEINQ